MKYAHICLPVVCCENISKYRNMAAIIENIFILKRKFLKIKLQLIQFIAIYVSYIYVYYIY